MMKHTVSLLLVVMTALSLSACGLESKTDANATVNRTYKLADAASGSQSASSSSDSAAPSRTTPLLYYPDSTGQYIVSRELSDLSLSDQTLDVKLVAALVSQGVLNQDVVLNSISFDLTEKEKQEVVLLDFSKALQTQISGCDPAKERLVVGSIVDTFLSAYGRELVQITIGGKKLISKNENSYADPVPWYDFCITEPFSKSVTVDDVRLKLNLTQIYSDAGFLLEQDTDQFRYHYDSATQTASFHAPDTRHQDETPACLAISVCDVSEAAALAQVRQSLGSNSVQESSVSVGVNQVAAACITATDDKGGTSCYVFRDDNRVWLAKLTWNAGEEDSRLARMDYMLSTFQAVS